jgi:transcriptional regulator with GAF, ATPase, and Fis domain
MPRAVDPTTVVVRSKLPAMPIGVVVRALGGSAKPGSFRLSSGSCIVGAGRDAHLCIADPTVSRRHVELSLVPEGVAVQDLGSRNGTFYLGQRVEKIVLAPGSRLTVGTVELAFEADTDSLCAGLDEQSRGYRGLIGASAAMSRLFAMLERLEGSLINVLVQGESGVGKEVVASAIHRGSRRAAAPFHALNCGGIARELVLSELFGHRRGAFTGAVEDRAGAFEIADGGTLFLDEIGELPLDVQPVLLRALESGEVRRVGDNAARKVNVRILAATNRDLSSEVEAGRFRADLYYRLAVVKLHVPPLRDRPEDVELLAQRFAADAGAAELPREVVAQLLQREWPGNVRELRNAVEAFIALGSLSIPDAQRMPMLDYALRELCDSGRPYAEQKDLLVERFTLVYLTKLLERTGGNQSEAARVSGLERSYLGKLLQKHGIAKR